MIVSLHDRNVSFASEDAETILDAAWRAGVKLPYSCKTGRCSTCRIQILSGTVRSTQEELGLTPAERKDSWRLSCIASATSDIAISVPDLISIDLPAPLIVPSKILEINRVTSRVMVVRLRLPPTATFTYLPGQYIDVIAPNGCRRSYSIANSKRTDASLDLHIARVQGGSMSNYWFENAAPGDLLRIHGPLGTFFLRDVSGRDVYFLATGTGIAPIGAMLEAIARTPHDMTPKSVTVFWGQRTREDFYVFGQDIVTKFNWTRVLSAPDSRWDGVTGYVQNALVALNPSLGNASVYACGSPAMIDDARQTLSASGLPDQQFYSDAFVASNNKI